VIDRPTLVRLLALYVPVLATLVLWAWRRPGRAWRTGCLLASLWNLWALLLLHVLAGRFGWWTLHAEGGLLLGLPVDVYLGWTLLWGAVPALAFPRLNLALVALGLAWVDALCMPAMAPVVRLEPGWLAGEAVGALLCLVPAQLLARWTAEDRRLALRAALQVPLSAGISLGLMPAIILEQTGGAWRPLWDRPAWQLGLCLQAVGLCGLLGVSAMQEFVQRGGGTAIPYDPPRHLVQSGPYAYLASPMQLSAMLTLAVWGVMLESPWVSAAAVMAHLYGLGIAGWDEQGDLHARFGDRWTAYRRAVPRWLPRFRPWHPALAGTQGPARLYVAESCEVCAGVKPWFERRRPVALEVVAAERHPDRDLERITYDPGDGSPEEHGIVAVARGLEHIHLGYALVGFAMRLPGVHHVLQLLADASGTPPRSIPRRPVSAPDGAAPGPRSPGRVS
jgi:protein-S-isoprenylcysteine O-methyltransferase Ste14